MLDKEIIKITEGLVHRVTVIQWVLGIEISAVISLLIGFATLMIKFFRDFRRDAIERMVKHEANVLREMSEVKTKIERDENESRENTENLIKHEGKIEGIIQVCKERHGK